MKVAIPSAKKFLAPLGISAAASAIDAGFQKKIHGSGRPSSSASTATTLIISNEEMNDKLVKILIFCWKESLKQLKIKQKNKEVAS